MGALDKFKKNEDEVKIVQVDMNNVFGTTLKDEDWDIATRENLERIAEKEAAMAAKAAAKEEEKALEEEEEEKVDEKFIVPGVGPINELPDTILGNAEELIKVLDKAKDREQWLYILDYAKNEAFDITLVDYLFEHDYTIKEYKRNSEVVDSQVKKQTGLFYRFFKKAVNERDEDTLNDLLTSISFVDDRVIEIVVNNKDRNDIISKNFLMKFDDEKKLFNALVDYEGIRDNKDFSFLNVMALTNLVQADIDKLLSSGYVVSEDSPDVILNNNELIRKLFLKDYDQDIINILLTKVNNEPGFSWKIHNFHNKGILTKEFVKIIGIKDVLNIIKYIEIPGIVINIDKVIEDGNLKKAKKLYDDLNTEGFNRQLFLDIINFYEINKELFLILCGEDVKDIEEQINVLFKISDKSHINSLVELKDIEEHIYQTQLNSIEVTTDVITLKDFICYSLIKENYLNVHKMLIELMGSRRLKDLRRNILNEKKKKEVDKYINLSLFLEELVECDNASVLKNIALTVSESVYKTNLWKREIKDIHREIIGLYTYEINEKMTNLKDFMTNQVFTSECKNVGYINIPNDTEYNLFTYKVPYYGNNKVLKYIKTSNYDDVTYLALNAISDQYTRLAVNKGEIIVLYNYLPDDSLIAMNNREMGIEVDGDLLNITANMQTNAMAFREIVRTTQQILTYSNNQYIVYKENMKPAGVLTVDIPTQEQLNAASYLNVPLVNIEQITQCCDEDNFGNIEINVVNEDEEEIVEEEISHENNNDQFLELFGSLLEIKGKPEKLLVAKIGDMDEYEIVEKDGTVRIVIPAFREINEFDSNIDIKAMLNDKIKSDIFKHFLPESSVNYEFKKVKVDGEVVLSAVYDKVTLEDKDISEYDITEYFKKMAIGYLIGDPYDADTYQIKQDSYSKSEQLFIDVNLLTEYQEEMNEISEAYCEDKVSIDFINLIDFIGKIDQMDDAEYLIILKDFIGRYNNISLNYIQEALLNKKHSLIKEIGKVIEKFTRDKDKKTN